VLIDINRIPSLRGINYEKGKGLLIGAATKLEEIERHPFIKDKYFALHQGVSNIGSPQVRSMGSIGGNSCTASPAADTPPSLIVYGARVNLISVRGKRELPIEEFILDNRVTALADDEFVESFILDEPWPNSSSIYLVMGLRNAMEIDIANLALNIAIDLKTCRVEKIRIAMGAVAPKPIRAYQAEAILKGAIPDEILIQKAAELCAIESRPIDDFRATASYRREVIKILAKRAIKKVLENILQNRR
jgi:carbon-monoxide dehydrogenase medium subunit